MATTNKYNLITKIGEICDENERLQIENEYLRNKLTPEGYTCEQPKLNEIEKNIFLEGLKKIAKDSSYSTPFEYPEIFNKSTRQFIPCNEWVNQITTDNYYLRYLPKYITDNLSIKQILELFKPYFEYKYNELKNNKQLELMEEGKENKEQENND